MGDAIPGCNWGAACGVRSGFFVMDFDGEQGVSVLQDWIKQYGTEWTQTRRVKTYRGEQLWFLWPTGERIRNSAGKIAPGVDVRAEEEATVVVPPSVIAQRAYLLRLTIPKLTIC